MINRSNWQIGLGIPAKIAEGAARQTQKEFMLFLHISRGSLSEVMTLIELHVVYDISPKKHDRR
ncbi:MAG: four helix bundle protein [Nitrospiraceae bacterium]|nr:four helix bundle protein [Nitrospira sp.]MCA9455730.1 four helix bundle protein [Nitrospira sp.]MCB9775082.1 four helix bundle protein [Nitrospiraceae bacterium]